MPKVAQILGMADPLPPPSLRRMTSPAHSFERCWWAAGEIPWKSGLKHATYHPIAYDRLPPLVHIDEEYAWLAQPRSEICSLCRPENNTAHLPALLTEARTSGLTLPAAFIAFMARTELQSRVPSITGCFLELSRSLIPLPGGTDAFALRFMNDSQSCLMWYLLLRRDEPARVLVSSHFLDPEIFEELADEEDPITYDEVLSSSHLCADTFIEFIQRFWLENTIWYAIQGKHPLSEAESRYLQAASQSALG